MANEEQLAILKQGVDVWNEWREQDRDIQVDLRGAYLAHVRLDRVNLRRVNLSGANLDGARLLDADLSQASLAGAHFRSADLRGADFRLADLTGVELSQAALNAANLSRAGLSRAGLTGAMLGYTILADVDLSEVKGLETIFHGAPSYISIETIYRSKGNVPRKFLLDTGWPEEAIDHLLPLAGKATKFYSCFISYSSKDQEFAQRLHDNLQSKGVRCWYAPHDMQIGAPIITEIDSAIRLYDKLLLILSENSVGSRWVEHEVLSATAKEFQQDRQGRVLFPIRLDDSVMESSESWVNSVRTRHIGDFTRWKDHDSYQKAFDRLLRDLRAGE